MGVFAQTPCSLFASCWLRFCLSVFSRVSCSSGCLQDCCVVKDDATHLILPLSREKTPCSGVCSWRLNTACLLSSFFFQVSFPVNLLQTCHGYLQSRPTKRHRWEIGLSFFPVKWYILEEDKQISPRWAPQRVRPGYVIPSMDTCPAQGTVVPRVSRILSNKKCNCPDRAKGTPFLHTRQLWGHRQSLMTAFAWARQARASTSLGLA